MGDRQTASSQLHTIECDKLIATRVCVRNGRDKDQRPKLFIPHDNGSASIMHFRIIVYILGSSNIFGKNRKKAKSIENVRFHSAPMINKQMTISFVPLLLAKHLHRALFHNFTITFCVPFQNWIYFFPQLIRSKMS